MYTIKNQKDLQNEIRMLEIQQLAEWPAFKGEIIKATESLNPFNMVKKTLGDVNLIPMLKGKLISGVVGMAAGYLTRNVLVGDTHNPLRKILGAFIQTEVAAAVTNDSKSILVVVKGISQIIKSMRSKTATEGE